MKVISKLFHGVTSFVHNYSITQWYNKNYTIKYYNDAVCANGNWKSLSKAQKKEIAEFWGIRHPDKFDFIIHEIMMNVNGDYDVRYCPENTFRLYLDDRMELKPWTDKNYYDRHQPELSFPHTYVRNVNGCFLDHDYHLISKDEARKIIVKNLPLIVKPSIDSGEGKNIRLISNEAEADELFTQYHKDYLLQELIVQCDMLKQLSPGSVSSVRLITAMINGKPKVLKQHLLCSWTDSIAVNAHAAPGEGVFVIRIDDDGKLFDTGYFGNAKKIHTLPSGISFSGMMIPSYKEAVDLALKAHANMPMMEFVGWDFTIDENNRPVFIEWNQRGIEIYNSQLSQGPLFGEYTDYFAEMARNKR